jgi:hypothetical protein
MSVPVRDIYNQVCYVLQEDFGLQLGVYSESQFLNALAVALLDFAQRAALDKKIFTTMINAGVSEYIVPDDVMKPELCFIGGRLIEKTTEPELAQSHYAWRKQWGVPKQWHEDNLAPKRIELFPKPNFNGANIPGDTPPIGVYGDFYPQDRNLTIVGPAGPPKTTWTLDDVLDGFPDIFSHYLVYGILEQVFSAEGETRDVQRAFYCRTRWQECFSAADAIAKEELMEDDD